MTTIDPSQNQVYLMRLFVLLRIYLGVILAITVFFKLASDAPFVVEETEFLNTMLSRGTMTSFYSDFLQTVVIPNAKLFSYLIMIGESVAAIGLMTGTLTRLSSLIAMFLFLNYMFAKSRWFWSPNSQDAAVFVIALVVMLSRAGRVAGVDGYLSTKFQNSFFLKNLL